MKKLILILFTLTAVLALTACTAATTEGTETDTVTTEGTADTSAATTEEATEENSGLVTYTVTVVDADGAPVAGVTVQMCDDSGCKFPVQTGEDGTAVLQYEASNYHVTVTMPEGYEADSTEYTFDEENKVTVTAVKTEQ